MHSYSLLSGGFQQLSSKLISQLHAWLLLFSLVLTCPREWGASVSSQVDVAAELNGIF